MSVMESNAVSHRHAIMAAFEPASSEKYGDINMLNTSLTPLGYSVWNSNPRRRTSTVWVTRGGLRCMAYTHFRQAISREVLAFSLLIGAIYFIILGIFSMLCTWHIWVSAIC